MNGTANITINDKSKAFHSNLSRMTGSETWEMLTKMSFRQELTSGVADMIEQTYNSMIGRDNTGDIYGTPAKEKILRSLTLCIDGKTAYDFCSEKHGEMFTSLKDEEKSNALMCAEVYSAMLERDKVVDVVRLNTDDPKKSEIYTLRPEIKPAPSNIFVRLWNSFMEAIGAAGTNKAMLRSYDLRAVSTAGQRESSIRSVVGEKADALREKEEKLEAAADAAQKTTERTAARRVEVDAGVLGKAEEARKDAEKIRLAVREAAAAAKIADEADKDAFFGGLKPDELGKHAKAMNIDMDDIDVNLARLYMFSQGSSIDSIMGQGPLDVTAKNAAGKAVYEMIQNVDKKGLVDMASKAAERLSKGEDYPKFDIAKDADIVNQVRQRDCLNKMIVNLSNVVSSYGVDAPYREQVKATLGDKVFADYEKHSENYTAMYEDFAKGEQVKAARAPEQQEIKNEPPKNEIKNKPPEKGGMGRK